MQEDCGGVHAAAADSMIASGGRERVGKSAGRQGSESAGWRVAELAARAFGRRGRRPYSRSGDRRYMERDGGLPSVARCADWGEAVRNMERRRRRIVLTPVSCVL